MIIRYHDKTDIIGNVIGRNEYRVQQIQNTYNVKIYAEFQNKYTRHKNNSK